MSAVDAVRGRLRYRRLVDRIMSAVAALAFALVIAPLVGVIAVAVRGASLSPEVWARCLPALVGTLELLLLTALIAVPVGVLGGAFTAELAPRRWAPWLRVAVDALAGIPPIVVGLFVFATVVLPMGGFSLFAGAVALALVAIPTIARATDDLLALIPAVVRDAGLGLGLPRHRVVLLVFLRTIRPGLGSVVVLSLARTAGEAAPLLFTAASSRWLTASPREPASSLPIEIFALAQSPGPEARATALTMTLVLLSLVAGLGWVARAVGRRAA